MDHRTIQSKLYGLCEAGKISLPVKKLRQLLKESGMAERFSAFAPVDRASGGETALLLKPLLDSIADEPADGWPKTAYDVLTHDLYPEEGWRCPETPVLDAVRIFNAVLGELIEGESTRFAFDPVADVLEVTAEEMGTSLHAEECARFQKLSKDAGIPQLYRLSGEVTPFNTGSHIIGVHSVAMHIARQAVRAGLPVDIPMLGSAAIAHDVGKFGCRGADAKRVPYLHYYYTYDWLSRSGLDDIAHLAANHSTWDLEFENLSIESIMLIYADFRVRGTRVDGHERMGIYTLADSYEMIFSKLADMTPQKELRYRTVYTKLSDFEGLLKRLGVETEVTATMQAPLTHADAALLPPEESLTALIDMTFTGNADLMHELSGEAAFSGLLVRARAEKNLHRIRTSLRLLSEYSTYMTAAAKRQTLEFLYELLMHHQGDVRRNAARIMGYILANSGPRYRKELPASAPGDALPPATMAILSESVSLWEHYMDMCLHPDPRISERHRERIMGSLKAIAASLFLNCQEAERIHYLTPFLNRLYHAGAGERFFLVDSMFYIPWESIEKDDIPRILDCFESMVESGDEALRITVLRRIERLSELCDEEQEGHILKICAMVKKPCSAAELYIADRILKKLHHPTVERELSISDIYLANLKTACHWMVKLTQVDMLEDDAYQHPENAFHTAMHLSNILSVSEHLPVRERAGAALIRLFRLLTVSQRNEIVVDLIRELETGQDEISVYISLYLGRLLAKMPQMELLECLDTLEGYVKSGSERTAGAALSTLGSLLSVSADTMQDAGSTRGRTMTRILGILMSGIAHFNPSVHENALMVLTRSVLGSREIPLAQRKAWMVRISKKLLTLLSERREGRYTFYTRCAAMNHLYRFLVEARLDGGFTMPEARPAAFFPGTFDPFSAGHRKIVEAIIEQGFTVYLAIDEFSWSKQPLPKMQRRTIAQMSVADIPEAYIFPDEIPVNIASKGDITRLKELFRADGLYLVTGSDVIEHASAYRMGTEGGAASLDHIIFLRDGNDDNFKDTVRDRVSGRVIFLHLDAFYETVSSTLIRECVDQSMDISSYVDPMVQAYIYQNGLYLRAPQYKHLHEMTELEPVFTVCAEGEYLAELTSRKDGTRVGSIRGRSLRSTDLYGALKNIDTAEYLRQMTSGRILYLELEDAVLPQDHEETAVLINELLVRSLVYDHTFAVADTAGDAELLKLLSEFGFQSAAEHSSILYVDMRSPVVLVQDVLTRFKEPHRSSPEVIRACMAARPKLRLALTRMFPTRLIASFDTRLLEQAVIRRVQEINGVQDVPAGKRQLGPYMCVPYGKILSGELVPNTVTKALHAVKAYGDSIGTFSITEYPGYSTLQNQTRTVKSFNRPVILVDDLLHKGYRIEKLDAYFRAEDLPIRRIVVGIMSGRGQDLMTLQGREADGIYLIPNLHFWFTESLLYPFIGGDSKENCPQAEGALESVNMILPYYYPTYLKDASRESVISLSRTCLENTRDILQSVERFHLAEFHQALTVRHLAEALIYPRVPYRGDLVRYDYDAAASGYAEDDLKRLERTAY